MITFVNTVKENVLDSLDTLITAEFTDIPIFYDEELIARGNTWFVIQPQTDELIERRTVSEVRQYTTLIRVFRHVGGEHRKHSHIDPITNTVERLKRLLINNAEYSSSGTYKYHDGEVTLITYQVTEEDLPEYKIIDVTHSAIVEEVLL